MNDARVGEELPHPPIPQRAGDGIVGQRADKDGQLLDISAREVAEINMSGVWRHELAEHKSAPRSRQEAQGPTRAGRGEDG